MAWTLHNMRMWDLQAVRLEGGKPANTSGLALIKQTFEAAGMRFTQDGRAVPPGKGKY